MSETDMTEYAELLRHLRLLARGKHDDVSIAADAEGAIIALLAERDALRAEMGDAREALQHVLKDWNELKQAIGSLTNGVTFEAVRDERRPR